MTTICVSLPILTAIISFSTCSPKRITGPIIGTTAEHHVIEAVTTLGITLTEEEITLLEAPYIIHPVLGMM